MAPLELSLQCFILLLSVLGSGGRPMDVTQAAKHSELMTLVTTSYVERMPAFLASQSPKLEIVDGNPCVTVETVEEREVGNLMARKTCWCMTVIEVPVTPSVTSGMVATVHKTPVFTTTVTVFASSVIETVYETVQRPEVESPSTVSSLFESVWVPESIISTSWPSNTIEHSRDTSWSSIAPSPIDHTASAGIVPSSSDAFESSSIETSFSTLSLTSDEGQSLDYSATPSFEVTNSDSSSQSFESFSPRSGEIETDNYVTEATPTVSLHSTSRGSDGDEGSPAVDDQTMSSSRDASIDSASTNPTSAPRVSDTVESSASFSSLDFDSGISSTMTATGQSLVPPLWSSRKEESESEIALQSMFSSKSPLENSSDWLTPTPSLGTGIVEYSSAQISTPIQPERDSSQNIDSSEELPTSSVDASIDATNTLSLSRSGTLVTRFPPWTKSRLSSTTESDDEISSAIPTPSISLEHVSTASSSDAKQVDSSPNIVGSSTFDFQGAASVSDDHLSSMEETPCVSSATEDVADTSPSVFPTTVHPSDSTYVASTALQSERAPSFDPSSTGIGSSEANFDSFSPSTASKSRDLTPELPTQNVESSSSSTSNLPTSTGGSSRVSTPSPSTTDSFRTPSTAEITENPSVSVPPSRSSKQLDSSEVEDVTVSGSRTQTPPLPSTSQESLWTHRTKVTFVPSRTSIAVTYVKPSSTTTTPKPPAPSDQDTQYWIQTELTIPRGTNSTDTSKLVKNLAFIYERAYAAQYRRQRRQSGRLATIKLIHVRADYKERNMTLVYVLHYLNRLVPAVEAVKKLQVVRQADMERLLEHGVIVKAKPYEPMRSTASLEDNRLSNKAYIAWVIVLVLLLLLLLLLIVLLYLCVRNRSRQKADVKDAEVSSSFSQGEGKFSATSGITMPGESIRSYRDAVTSPVHFGGTGTYRRSESPKFYENEAFDPDEPKLRKRPVLTQHTFEATFESQPQQAKAELTPPEVKPRRRKMKPQESADLSTCQDTTIPAAAIEIRPVVSEVASEDDTPGPSEEEIEEARRQLESMTERLNALVDNSLTVEQAKTKLHGSYRQKLLISRKDYKRSRSADSIDKVSVSSVPSVSNPIFRDQPTQTSFAKKATPPHFLVTIHKETAAKERRLRQESHRRVVEEFESTSRVTYREPTSRVIEAIRHELDLAQDFPKESFA